MKNSERKIVNIFLSISLNICFGFSKEQSLIETVLLSTHNICFGSDIRKLFLIMHSYLKACKLNSFYVPGIEDWGHTVFGLKQNLMTPILP